MDRPFLAFLLLLLLVLKESAFWTFLADFLANRLLTFEAPFLAGTKLGVTSSSSFSDTSFTADSMACSVASVASVASF